MFYIYKELPVTLEVLRLKLRAFRDGSLNQKEIILNKMMEIDQSPWTLFLYFKFLRSQHPQKKSNQLNELENKIKGSAKESALDFCAAGNLYLELNELEKVEDQFKQAKDRDPKSVLAHWGMIDYFWKTKDEEQELVWIRKLKLISEHDYNALEGEAKILFLQKKNADCLEIISEIEKECCPNEDIKKIKADCLYFQGHYMEAREQYLSLAKTASNSLNLELWIGKSYCKQNLFKKVKII